MPDDIEDEVFIPSDEFVGILNHLEAQREELQSGLIGKKYPPEVIQAALEYLDTSIAAIYEEDWGAMTEEALQARCFSIINDMNDVAKRMYEELL
jgi:hypothetical protein